MPACFYSAKHKTTKSTSTMYLVG